MHEGITISLSYASVKRLLVQLISENLVSTKGQRKGTKYHLSEGYEMFRPIVIDEYYQKEMDERKIKREYNFDLIPETLNRYDLFNPEELTKLNLLHEKFKSNIKNLEADEIKKEMERLAIDLSWKSSQIEGNTYSLLETERLLKEKHTAAGKTKDEAVMLLNHKEALDFIIDHPDYLHPLTLKKIEDVHSILIKELGVDRNLRRRKIGISGTNYRPLDNEFQIYEALEEMCKLINKKQNVFEKALLILLLISYIQPFADGNKRTARIVCNAILLHHEHCPISFRTVDSLEYKKAMLVFYEQNNISAFKEIFIGQFEFAVETYF